MNLMIVPGILICISFLISVCMFIVSKALLISSAIVIVRAGGAIWLNPFTTVLINVCSAVTVQCCVLYRCCVGVFLSFCLPHPVAVSAFMICRGLCACTEMLWMSVLYMGFGSNVRPRTFGCVVMGSALLFIVRSRVQVVLSGLSKSFVLFCPGKNFIRYSCMDFLTAFILVCVDVIVMSSA